MAESFCERIISCVNQIMTEGRTLLSSEDLEIVAILRMNEAYIRKARMRDPSRMRRLLLAKIAEGEAAGGGGSGEPSSSSGAGAGAGAGGGGGVDLTVNT